MTSETPQFRRTDDAVIRIGGADALSFLQTKLACDTRRWRMTGGGFGLATDINGKLLFEGHFALGDDGAVYAVMPSTVADAAVEHIDRYVIMEKVEAARLPGACTWVALGDAAGEALERSDDEEPARARPVTWTDVDLVAFRSPGPVPGATRWWIVASNADDAGRDTVEEALVDHGFIRARLDAIHDADVRAGVPALGRDYETGATIPIEAGLWNGVSLSKGCYLGQEVLERLFSRGAAAKRLVRFAVDGDEVAPGTTLRMEGGEVGTVTSSVTDAAGAIGMAWLKRKALADPSGVTLDGDGRAVRVLGLVGGPDPENP
jgi:folate-binding protein YgfZ